LGGGLIHSLLLGYVAVESIESHGVVTQKTELFVNSVVRASNPKYSMCYSETGFIISCNGDDVFGACVLPVGDMLSYRKSW
jgi:hypothetical protein